MKDWKVKVAAMVLLIVGFFTLMGVAGDYDWSEQVVLHMNQHEYDCVKDTLRRMNGSNPSQREIAHWWAEHHGQITQEW